MNSFVKQYKHTSVFDKILFLTGFLIASALPLYAKLSSILLFVLMVVILISRGKLMFNKEHISSFSWSATTALLFLIPIIAILLSDSIYDSIRATGKQLLYLLVPLALLCLSDKKRKNGLSIIKIGLVIGAITASVIMLINLGVRVVKNPEPFQINTIFNYYHTYYNFTSVIGKHPTYLGTELFLAIVFLSNYLTIIKKLPLKITAYVALAIMAICLVFINSRVVLSLFTFFALFNIVRYIIHLFRAKRVLRLMLFLLSFLVLGGLAYKMISKTYVFHRYTHELSWELSEEVGTKVNSTVSSDSRMARWNSALRLIQENWLLGYGNNSEKRELYKQYKEDGLTYAMKYRYDAHNIYLAYWVEYGIWGLGLMLVFIFRNFVQSFKQRNLNKFFVILMIVIVGLSENILKTSEGILITTLFVNLLVFQKDNHFFEATK